MVYSEDKQFLIIMTFMVSDHVTKMENQQTPRISNHPHVYRQLMPESHGCFATFHVCASFVYNQHILTTLSIQSMLCCANALQSCTAHDVACIRWLFLNTG